MNSFVTLTYRDEEVPRDRSSGFPTLRPKDMVDFLKRLRRAREPEKIRFFQCGEYGEQLGRPHHHALLFNCGFPDQRLWTRTAAGCDIFRSQELEELWPHGHSSVGAVTAQSAAYTARYTLKKFGDSVQAGQVPPYVTMSRGGRAKGGGIGTGWFRKYSSDVYPLDAVVLRGGVKQRPPRFYDELLKESNRRLHDRVKSKRVKAALSERAQLERGSMRLYAKEVNLTRRVRDFLKRGVE